MAGKVLLVDDDPAVREALGQTLDLGGFSPLSAGSFVEAKDNLRPEFEGVVVSDIRMPGRDGFHLLSYVRGVDPDLPVILLTGEGDIPMAVQAMSQGAFGFLEKPCSPQDLTALVDRALSVRAMVLENRRFRAQQEVGDPAARLIFGVSEASETLRKQVRAAARLGREVLVQGAPGSGISKVAEVVHLCSGQAKGPFAKRAAAGLSRAGLIDAWDRCQGGALFFDEIGQMPMDTQMALLDAVDRGGTVLIAGCTEDLEAATAQGRVSTDLFYRLAVCQVRIPALAERPEDIPVLFRLYVAQAAEQAGVTAPEITPDVLAGLMVQEWPGNARALMSHAMRFALGLGDSSAGDAGQGLVERMAQVERSLLVEALRKAGGQARQAAEALKLPRKTLYDKLAKHGLKPEQFRDS